MLINDDAATAASHLMDEAAELMTAAHLAAPPLAPAGDEVSNAVARNLAALSAAYAADATQSASAMRAAAQSLRATLAAYRATEEQNASAYDGSRFAAAGSQSPTLPDAAPSGPTGGAVPQLPPPATAATSPIPSISGRPARDNTALLESGPGSAPLLAHATALPDTAAQHARAAQLLAEAGTTMATGTDAAFTPGATAHTGHLAAAALRSAANTNTLASQYGALAAAYDKTRASVPSSVEIEATTQQLQEAIQQNASTGGAMQPYVDSLWQRLQTLQSQTDSAVDNYQADGDATSDPAAAQHKAIDPSLLLGIVSALPQLAQQLSQMHLPQANPSQAIAPLAQIAQMAGSLLSHHPSQQSTPFRPFTPSNPNISSAHTGKTSGGPLHPAGFGGKPTPSPHQLPHAPSPTGTKTNSTEGTGTPAAAADPAGSGFGMFPAGMAHMARSGENKTRTSKYDHKAPAAPEQTGRAPVDRPTTPKPIAVPESVKEKIQARAQARAQARSANDKENT